MDNLAAYDVIVYFFSQIDLLLVILVRLLGFFLFVPVISGQNIWMQGRLFLALVMAIALFMSGNVTAVYMMDSPLGYVYILLLEFMVGMAMGYALFATFNLIFFAGQLMDFQIGLMMVNVLDPMTQIQVPLTGNLFFFSLLAMLVVTGGLHGFFYMFFYSYTVLPIGTAVIAGNSDLAWYLILLLVQTMVLAVAISMPIFGTMMVINVALGVMVKTVPQMNIFVVGLPFKLIVGSILLWIVMVPNIGTMYWLIFNMAHDAMLEVMWGLRPR